MSRTHMLYSPKCLLRPNAPNKQARRLQAHTLTDLKWATDYLQNLHVYGLGKMLVRGHLPAMTITRGTHRGTHQRHKQNRRSDPPSTDVANLVAEGLLKSLRQQQAAAAATAAAAAMKYTKGKVYVASEILLTLRVSPRQCSPAAAVP